MSCSKPPHDDEHSSSVGSPSAHLSSSPTAALPAAVPDSTVTSASNSDTEVTSSSPSTTATAIPWNLDAIVPPLEDKNPFGGMSEEEINKMNKILDTALSTKEGQEILSQVEVEDEKTVIIPDNHSTIILPQGNIHDSLDIFEDPDAPIPQELIYDDSEVILQNDFQPLADLNESFSDHAYCIHPTGNEDDTEEISDNHEDDTDSKRGDAQDSSNVVRVRRSTRIQETSERNEANKIRAENSQREKEAILAMQSADQDKDEEDEESADEKEDTKGNLKQYNMREKRPLREDGRIDYTKRGRPRGRPANTKHSADEDSIKVDSAPEDSETSPASTQEPRRGRGRGFAKRGRGMRGRGRGRRGGNSSPAGSSRQPSPPQISDQKSESSSNEEVNQSDSSTEDEDKDESPVKSNKKTSKRKTKKERKTVKQRENEKNRKEDTESSEDDLPLTSFISKNERNKTAKTTKKKSKKGGKKADDHSSDENVKGKRKSRTRIRGKKDKKTLKKKGEEKAEESPSECESEEEEAEEEGSESDWESEDDPDRLWCFCKKPFNNRFMICCDTCGEWYHGSCVGMTRAQGKQITKRGERWICTTCGTGTEKKKRVRKQKSKTSNESEQPDNKTSVDSLSENSADDDELLSSLQKQVREPTKKSKIKSPIPGSKGTKVKTSDKIENQDSGEKMKYDTFNDNIKKEPKDHDIKKTDKYKEQIIELQLQLEKLKKQKVWKDVKVPPKDSDDEAENKNTSGIKNEVDIKNIIDSSSNVEMKDTVEITAKKIKEEIQENPSDSVTEEPMEVTEEVKPSVTEKKKDKGTKAKTKKIREKCLVCKGRAKADSIYCCEQCIWQHAQDSIKLIENERAKTYGSRKSDAPKDNVSNERIIVLERRTSKILTGPAAPTADTLVEWLDKHPTYEVLRPGSSQSKSSFSSKKEKTESQEMRELRQKREARANKEKKAKEMKLKVSKEKEQEKSKAVKDKDRKKEHGKERVKEIEKEKRVKECEKEKMKKVKANKNEKVKEKEKDQKKATEIKSPEKPLVPLKSGPDPVRLSVRKAFKDLLCNRANEVDDILVSTSEIKRLALDMEEELFRYYDGLTSKYKSKYRSLITNIRDKSNKGLFRKILNAEIQPYNLIRMSSEKLSSKEMAIWKDDTESNLLLLEDSPEKETPEKEEKSEKEPKIVQELYPKPEPPPTYSYSPSADLICSIIVDTTAKHKAHLFDANCKICTGKLSGPPEVPKKTEKDKPSGADHSQQPSSPPPMSTLPKKPKEPILKDEYAPAMSGSVLDRAYSGWEQNSSYPTAVSSSRPSYSWSETDSTKETSSSADVNMGKSVKSSPRKSSSLSQSTAIQPPPSGPPLGKKYSGAKITRADPRREHETKIGSSTSKPSHQYIWRGSIQVQGYVKFAVTSHRVSGSMSYIKEELIPSLKVTGRLPLEQVYKYIARIKAAQVPHRDVCVMRFRAGATVEQKNYEQLFMYLYSRGRCGVISNINQHIKDLYIMPLASDAQVPSVLMPFHGPGLDVSRPNLLLGVVIKQGISKPVITATAPTGLPVAAASAPVKTTSPTTKVTEAAPAAHSKLWMYSERVDTAEEKKKNANTSMPPTMITSGTAPDSTTKMDADDEDDNMDLVIDESDPKEGADDSDSSSEAEISEKHKHDPIIVGYTKVDSKKLKEESKPVLSVVEEPYDPDDYDSNNEDSVTEQPVTAQTTASATISSLPVVSRPSTSEAPALFSAAQILSTYSEKAAGSIPSVKPSSAVVPPPNNPRLEEHRLLLAQLTLKVEEQKQLLEKKKQQSVLTSSTSHEAAPPVLDASKQSNVADEVKKNSADPTPAAVINSALENISTNLARQRLAQKLAKHDTVELPQTSTINTPTTTAGFGLLPPTIQSILTGQSLANLTSIVKTASTSQSASDCDKEEKVDELEAAMNDPGGKEKAILLTIQHTLQEEETNKIPLPPTEKPAPEENSPVKSLDITEEKETEEENVSDIELPAEDIDYRVAPGAWVTPPANTDVLSIPTTASDTKVVKPTSPIKSMESHMDLNIPGLANATDIPTSANSRPLVTDFSWIPKTDPNKSTARADSHSLSPERKSRASDSRQESKVSPDRQINRWSQRRNDNRRIRDRSPERLDRWRNREDSNRRDRSRRDYRRSRSRSRDRGNSRSTRKRRSRSRSRSKRRDKKRSRSKDRDRRRSRSRERSRKRSSSKDTTRSPRNAKSLGRDSGKLSSRSQNEKHGSKPETTDAEKSKESKDKLPNQPDNDNKNKDVKTADVSAILETCKDSKSSKSDDTSQNKKSFTDSETKTENKRRNSQTLEDVSDMSLDDISDSNTSLIITTTDTSSWTVNSPNISAEFKSVVGSEATIEEKGENDLPKRRKTKFGPPVVEVDDKLSVLDGAKSQSVKTNNPVPLNTESFIPIPAPMQPGMNPPVRGFLSDQVTRPQFQMFMPLRQPGPRHRIMQQRPDGFPSDLKMESKPENKQHKASKNLQMDMPRQPPGLQDSDNELATGPPMKRFRSEEAEGYPDNQKHTPDFQISGQKPRDINVPFMTHDENKPDSGNSSVPFIKMDFDERVRPMQSNWRGVSPDLHGFGAHSDLRPPVDTRDSSATTGPGNLRRPLGPRDQKDNKGRDITGLMDQRLFDDHPKPAPGKHIIEDGHSPQSIQEQDDLKGPLGRPEKIRDDSPGLVGPPGDHKRPPNISGHGHPDNLRHPPGNSDNPSGVLRPSERMQHADQKVLHGDGPQRFVSRDHDGLRGSRRDGQDSHIGPPERRTPEDHRGIRGSANIGIPDRGPDRGPQIPHDRRHPDDRRVAPQLPNRRYPDDQRGSPTPHTDRHQNDPRGSSIPQDRHHPDDTRGPPRTHIGRHPDNTRGPPHDRQHPDVPIRPHMPPDDPHPDNQRGPPIPRDRRQPDDVKGQHMPPDDRYPHDRRGPPMSHHRQHPKGLLIPPGRQHPDDPRGPPISHDQRNTDDQKGQHPDDTRGPHLLPNPRHPDDLKATSMPPDDRHPDDRRCPPMSQHRQHTSNPKGLQIPPGRQNDDDSISPHMPPYGRHPDDPRGPPISHNQRNPNDPKVSHIPPGSQSSDDPRGPPISHDRRHPDDPRGPPISRDRRMPDDPRGPPKPLDRQHPDDRRGPPLASDRCHPDLPGGPPIPHDRHRPDNMRGPPMEHDRRHPDHPGGPPIHLSGPRPDWQQNPEEKHREENNRGHREPNMRMHPDGRRGPPPSKTPHMNVPKGNQVPPISFEGRLRPNSPSERGDGNSLPKHMHSDGNRGLQRPNEHSNIQGISNQKILPRQTSDHPRDPTFSNECRPHSAMEGPPRPPGRNYPDDTGKPSGPPHDRMPDNPRMLPGSHDVRRQPDDMRRHPGPPVPFGDRRQIQQRGPRNSNETIEPRDARSPSMERRPPGGNVAFAGSNNDNRDIRAERDYEDGSMSSDLNNSEKRRGIEPLMHKNPSDTIGRPEHERFGIDHPRHSMARSAGSEVDLNEFDERNDSRNLPQGNDNIDRPGEGARFTGGKPVPLMGIRPDNRNVMTSPDEMDEDNYSTDRSSPQRMRGPPDMRMRPGGAPMMRGGPQGGGPRIPLRGRPRGAPNIMNHPRPSNPNMECSNMDEDRHPNEHTGPLDGRWEESYEGEGDNEGWDDAEDYLQGHEESHEHFMDSEEGLEHSGGDEYERRPPQQFHRGHPRGMPKRGTPQRGMPQRGRGMPQRGMPQRGRGMPHGDLPQQGRGMPQGGMPQRGRGMPQGGMPQRGRARGRGGPPMMKPDRPDNEGPDRPPQPFGNEQTWHGECDDEPSDCSGDYAQRQPPPVFHRERGRGGPHQSWDQPRGRGRGRPQFNH